MRCAERRKLEAFALGQLDGAAAGDAAAHVAACADCAAEAAVIAAERRIFARRAALPAPALPSFADVMERSREGGPAAAAGARRARVWATLSAAAALVGFYAADRGAPGPAREGEAPAIMAEPANGGRCEDPVAATAGAVACAEDEHAACLTATPAAPPPAADDSCACDVTCGPEGPTPGEDLESKVQGDAP